MPDFELIVSDAISVSETVRSEISGSLVLDVDGRQCGARANGDNAFVAVNVCHFLLLETK